LSFGKPEKHKECAVEPDEICIGETPEMVAHVRPRHRRDLVDHDLAWLLDPGAAVTPRAIRVSGASRGLVVSGQTVIEAVASNRSS
jgi:hypothetical protein